MVLAAHRRVEISAMWFAVIVFNAISPEAWIGGVLIVVVGPPFVIAAVGELHHRGILCEHCMARFPLDGAHLAECRAAWLRYHHFVRPGAAILGLAACTCQLIFHNPIFLVLGGAELAIGAYDTKIHQRLEQWCPWCRHNDGDDDFEPAPAPLLDGYKS